MPENAVYVGRPSQWGNPFLYRSVGLPAVRLASRAEAADMYRRATVLWAAAPWWPDWLAPLLGRDLACWCPLDQPCHADVLLELAR